jgi:hypothetical protein
MHLCRVDDRCGDRASHGDELMKTLILRSTTAALALGLAACSGGNSSENVLIQNDAVLTDNVAADDLTLDDNGASDPFALGNETADGNSLESNAVSADAANAL